MGNSQATPDDPSFRATVDVRFPCDDKIDDDQWGRVFLKQLDQLRTLPRALRRANLLPPLPNFATQTQCLSLSFDSGIEQRIRSMWTRGELRRRFFRTPDGTHMIPLPISETGSFSPFRGRMVSRIRFSDDPIALYFSGDSAFGIFCVRGFRLASNSEDFEARVDAISRYYSLIFVLMVFGFVSIDDACGLMSRFYAQWADSVVAWLRTNMGRMNNFKERVIEAQREEILRWRRESLIPNLRTAIQRWTEENLDGFNPEVNLESVRRCFEGNGRFSVSVTVTEDELDLLPRSVSPSGVWSLIDVPPLVSVLDLKKPGHREAVVAAWEQAEDDPARVSIGLRGLMEEIQDFSFVESLRQNWETDIPPFLGKVEHAGPRQIIQSQKWEAVRAKLREE